MYYLQYVVHSSTSRPRRTHTPRSSTVFGTQGEPKGNRWNVKTARESKVRKSGRARTAATSVRSETWDDSGGGGVSGGSFAARPHTSSAPPPPQWQLLSSGSWLEQQKIAPALFPHSLPRGEGAGWEGGTVGKVEQPLPYGLGNEKRVLKASYARASETKKFFDAK